MTETAKETAGHRQLTMTETPKETAGYRQP